MDFEDYFDDDDLETVDRFTVAYRTEDGVPFKEGDTVYNYYDRKVCEVGEIDDAGWFSTFVPDGDTGHWKYDAYLNGERICSLEFAKKKGWVQ